MIAFLKKAFLRLLCWDFEKNTLIETGLTKTLISRYSLHSLKKAFKVLALYPRALGTSFSNFEKQFWFFFLVSIDLNNIILSGLQKPALRFYFQERYFDLRWSQNLLVFYRKSYKHYQLKVFQKVKESKAKHINISHDFG